MADPVPKPTYRKRKPEKAQKIIMQDVRECWVCGCVSSLESHHCFQGANRSKSEKYGLKVWLCNRHHNQNIPGDPGIHFNPQLRRSLQQEAQRKFEEEYSRETFFLEFGRSYL